MLDYSVAVKVAGAFVKGALLPQADNLDPERA